MVIYDWVRARLLKCLLPKEQYYIQAGDFHSHFNPVFHNIMTSKKGKIVNDNQITDKDDNS